MANCEWKLVDTTNTDPESATLVQFDSEQALDLYLKTEFDDIYKLFKDKGDFKLSKIFDISKTEIVDKILSDAELKTKEIIKSAKEAGFFEGMEEDSIKGHNHPDYIGITELTHLLEDTKSFDIEAYRLKLMESYPEEVVNNIINSYITMQEYGDDVHSIFQTVFQDNELPKTFKHLTLLQANEFLDEIKEFKQQLLRKYGQNSKFYSEFTISTTDINPDVKTILKESYNKLGISGTVDLLVRGEDGKTHIYDFKTSYHSPGDWDSDSKDTWHRNKKLGIQNQLAGYNVLLQQLGLELSTTHIVPIVMNYERDDKENIVGLNSWKWENTIDTVPQTTGGTIYRKWAVRIPRKFETKSKNLAEISQKLMHCIPNELINSQKIEKETKDIEYYKGKVYKIPITSQESFQNGKRMKYKFFPKELGKSPIYWENDEQMQKGLEAYIQELKNVRAVELDSIAVNIQNAMSGETSLDELDDLLSDQKKEFLADQIRRYVRGGWTFVRDKDLNGNGIFIFQKDNRTEIIGMTNQALGTAFKLTRGSSILGKTRYDKDVNSKDILDATTGNIELMKLMMFIAENQELFKDNKITQIKVINPWHGSQYVELNSVLKNNYNLLVQDNQNTYDKGELKRITEDIFYGDVVSLLSIADELLADAYEKNHGIYEFDRADMNTTGNEKYTEDWLNIQIRNLKRKHDFLYNTDKTGVGNNLIWEAYNYLLRANLAVVGLRNVQEFDKESYINPGIQTGTAVNSTGFSPSANIRMFDDIMQEFATDVRTEQEKIGRPLAFALNKFYASKGKNRIIGGEGSLFKEWFVTNPDGTINESFSVKDPSDASLSKESREALTIWLNVMQQLRFPNATDEDIQKLKDSGVYYQVPLMEASFTKQAKSLGVITALRNKVAQYSELTKDVFAGETSIKEQWRDKNGWILFNKFNLTQEQRAQKLGSSGPGIGFFETDLEIVINYALEAYTKSNLSPKYISRLNALSVSLKLAESYGGQSQKETREVLEKLIKSKFYGESIIPGTTLQAVARWLNVIKRGLSFMSLGFNPRSFLREFLQGTWMGISRAGLNNIPGITKETYMKAYEYVLGNAYKNFSSVSLLQQLDARCGVANYSLNNIHRKRRLNWTGIRNWNTDTAFWGSTSPDFQHRMTILVAKMMGDGIFDPDMAKSAYYLDKDGNAVYDWTKDKRFKICAEGLASKDVKEFAKTHPEFGDQYSLYEQYILELNRIGKKFKDKHGLERSYQIGDPLPEAYLPREIQALKNYSDLLYGHYDDESRSLIHDMFLGSFFMQYKTYITSRIEQWMLNPGTYNTELLQWEVDPITGEHLYKVHNDPDPDGRPNIVVMRESQIENLKQLQRENRVEKLYVWKGLPMEGIARSYINFFKRFKGLNWENIKDIKNNPVERDNLILGLHDTLFASFMLLLITGLFGLMTDEGWTTDHTKIAKEMRSRGWLHSFAYNVAYGSWTDFAIWNNAWSIVGDWNPPALTSAKRLVENSGAVILGKKTVFQAITNTVGAAADLKGLADKFADM